MLLLLPVMPYFAAVGGGGGVFGTVRTDTLGTTTGGNATVTFRLVFAAAGFTAPTGTPTQTRVTFSAGTSGGEGLRIAAAYIGHKAAAGDAYDFATTPVQILFSASGTVTIPTNTNLTSDAVNFAWDKVTDVVIAFYCDSAANDSAFRGAGLPNVSEHTKVANDASTVDATGYSGAVAGRITAVSKIEMDGF